MINKQLIDPDSIVVVGGSNDKSKIGGALIKNLTEHNFKGTIYAVNPKETEVQGFRCFQSAEQVPDVEMAIICVAASYVKATVEELANHKNCKAFIILSAGFAEMGEEGHKLQDEILAVIDKNAGALIGPNCIGVLTQSYAGIFAGPIPKLDPQGCDFVCASGATAAWIVEKGMLMGLSFSSIFTVGNSAQIGVEDVVQYWDETFDPQTSSKIKLFYIESVSQPQKLLKHASSLISKGCRIAAIKSGSSEAGSRAVTSHTGALASPDRAVDALFRKAGIVRCHGKEDLVTSAAVFCQPELKGKRIAIITQAGGPGVMLTDALEAGGLQVPPLEGPDSEALLAKLFPGSSVANPIDFLATGTPAHVAHTIDAVNDKFDNIDGMAVIFGSTGLTDISEALTVISEKTLTSKKPVYTILPSVVTGKREADDFQALGNVSFSDEVLFARALAAVAKTPQPAEQVALPGIDLAAIRSIIESCEDGYLAPEKVQALLDAAGIDRAGEAVVASKADAVKKAVELGFPVVMKVVGPVHKSDVGGVVLNIKNTATVADEFERMIKIADTTAILIQPMLSGTELFVGAKHEENFGHMILCGLGGVFIEILHDTAAELSPVSTSLAAEMIQSLKSYKIIQGARGQKGVDEQKFAEAISRLSALCQAAPEIKELDLNPLLGSMARVVAVDSRIRIEQDKVQQVSRVNGKSTKVAMETTTHCANGALSSVA
ncbi:MAG: acetate--CoA ligase family protein [Desulfuromonadales bacterium]|nr:acetate--CoA ligase family protein [Desulfuromonadales bacterium]